MRGAKIPDGRAFHLREGRVQAGGPINVNHRFGRLGNEVVGPAPFGDQDGGAGNAVFVGDAEYLRETADFVRKAIANILAVVAVFMHGDGDLVGMVAGEAQKCQHLRAFPIARFRFTGGPTKRGPFTAVAQRHLANRQGKLSQPLRTVFIHFVHRFHPHQTRVQLRREGGCMLLPVQFGGLLRRQVVVRHTDMVATGNFAINQRVGHAALAHQLLGHKQRLGIVGAFQEKGHPGGV